VNFEVLVPLLRGLGKDSTGAAEAAARGDAKVAKLLYQHSLAAQAFNTAASYWSSRAADDSYTVQRDVERAASRLVESTKVLVDSRIFPPAFLLQAEANFREKRTVRINAELDARSARFSLGQALGLPPEQIAQTPAPTDSFPPVAELGSLTTDEARTPMIRHALASRMDYLATVQSIVPLNILARQAVIDLKPRINLTLNAGYQGLSTTNDAVAPLRERVTGSNGSVGVALDWPFSNSYQRGLLRERRANIAQVEAQAVQLSQSIASDVLLALEQVRLRADAVRSAKDTVDLSSRALAAQYAQLKTGDGTILDVLSLENLSSGARIRYINAHAAYAIALAQLRFALGAIFEQRSSTGTSFSLTDLSTPPAL
jgi:outer membrane protein TolC